MPGSVVTFYSYKGGVGRSFALANIAVILGQWGFRVLCIDWDLEAPGLAHFFRADASPSNLDEAGDEQGPGVVELLTDFRATKQVPLQWRDYIEPLGPRLPGLSLLGAGKADASYTRRLQKLNWRGLYRLGLGQALETMFDELREEFDYILIDSRTGITDFSGIITAQLPDILVFLFTANDQSLAGAIDVARRSAEARNALSVDRSRLLLLPVPARFETQVEHEISTWWRERFAVALQGFYDPWAHADAPLAKLIQATSIPYVPFWSFGERLAVIEEKSRDSLSISYSLETIAALLAHRMSQTRLLLESRDEFVSSARRISRQRRGDTYDVFISYMRADEEVAVELSKNLENLGVRTALDKLFLRHGDRLETALSDEIGRSENMIVLLGDSTNRSRWQDYEIRTFLRQAATDEMPRRVIPVVISERNFYEMPTLLRDRVFLSLENNYGETAAKIASAIRRVNVGDASGKSELSILVTGEDGSPINGATVCALAENGTTVEAMSDASGSVDLSLVSNRSYKLLLAHPEFRAKIEEKIEAIGTQRILLESGDGYGSVVIHSAGYLPGLSGRINPIRDTSNRTYIYADNISINDGANQPARFTPNESVILEDADGVRVEMVVKLIEGRTALLEFRRQSRNWP